MSFALTEEEWLVLQHMPDEDLVSLAAELDMLVPETIRRRELIEECIPHVLTRGRADGLPFSKYDREDLAALPQDHLNALGAIINLSTPTTVSAVLKAGAKVYKRYQKERRDSALALLLPSLLSAVARAAATPGSSS